MKRVSFSVAKALKEAGYPQDSHKDNIYISEPNAPYAEVAYQPTCLEAWLWLWREKNIQIDIDYAGYNTAAIASMYVKGVEFPDVFEKNDPEEAIESAINYLVEHNLIK